MRPETLELYRRLKESNWTAHAGEPVPESACIRPERAMEIAASEESESVYLHESNLLAAAISSRSYERFKQWNEVITDERRREIIDLVDVKFPPDGPLGDVPHGLKTGLQWLVAHALIESEFDDAHDRRFFREAVAWLIRGRIICGWTEDWWPKGKAVIY